MASTSSGRRALTSSTASRTGIDTPRSTPWAARARTSFGRQLPPKPQPASRNEVIGAFLPGHGQVRRGMKAAHHVDDVDVPDGGTQVGELVRERDHRRQERVRGVLDRLRRRHRRPDPRHVRKPFVEVLEDLGGALVVAAEDQAVGFHEVLDCLPLGEELRVGRHAEADTCPPVRRLLEDRRHHVARRSGDDRALDDDDGVVVTLTDRLAHGAGRRPHGAEVDVRPVERCADGNHRHVGAPDGLCEVCRRVEVLADVALEQLVEPLLEDRRAPGGDRAHPFLVQVDACDVVTLVSQADAGNEPDVAETDDRDPHQASADSRFSAYHCNERRSPSSSPTFGP